ncbi:phosphodiesterase [Kiloniella sp.]|uniref:phosphodiesterase n=1 Tax=Kiloniella sp. TaxID=1938587 RepID=UPI003B018FF0
MLKSIWMSDPHFSHEGDVLGHNPRVRIEAAVSYVNAHHSDSSFCFISGDMVNRGTVADYNALAAYLDKLKVPFLPMVGNHDDRELFRSTFSLPDTCMVDFIQYSVQTDEGLFVCLDTQKSGSDAGEFCEIRRDWLRKVLAEAADTPVYLFMHHPPMKLGLPMQDTENMENGEAFLQLLAEYSNVEHLFIGHVHRPITGTVKGIPFATMRSVLYQAPSPLPEWGWETFKPSEEAPNLGVLTISNADVNLQYLQFCDYRMGTSSSP